MKAHETQTKQGVKLQCCNSNFYVFRYEEDRDSERSDTKDFPKWICS